MSVRRNSRVWWFCAIWGSLIILSFLFHQVIAAPLKFFPVKLVQPSGVAIHVFISGDEYYHWIHDAQNFTIIRNPQTGYYVYADMVNGILIPTDNIVGKTDPKTLKLKRKLNISPQKMLELRKSSLLNTSISTQSAPTTGTINNLAVFIRFSDESEFTDKKATYEDMFNSSTSGTNSMQNYFYEASYNKLSVITTFYPSAGGLNVASYQDSHPRGYYQPYNGNNTIGYKDGNESTAREQTLLANAAGYITSQVPSSLAIDGDNDGNIDNVCYIISGDIDGGNILYPHKWDLYSVQVYINSKRVWSYNIQMQDHLISSGPHVLCHEMFHSLGAPDLYHYSGGGINPLGPWDLMETDLNPPEHMSAYMKYRYGHWISSIPVISNGTYSLNPLISPYNNCYRINSPNSNTEYYVVEYRKKTGTFESSLPGSGLLVYRVNSALDGQGNSSGPPDELYVYRPNGTLTSNGQVNEANFDVYEARTGFADFTNPSPFLSNGAAGKINIFNIQSGSSTLSFSIGDNNKAPVPDFSALSTEVSPADTAKFYDNSFGMPTSWTWNFDGGLPLSSVSQNPSNIIYNSLGRYSVSHTASNSFGKSNITKTNFISVTYYRTQNFESDAFPPANWQVQPESGNSWTRSDEASAYGKGMASAKYEFFYSGTGNTQYLVTNNFAPTLTGDSLRFDHAYATYENQIDRLTVETSANGGNSYSELVTLTGGSTVGSGMVTAPPTTDYFVPSQEQWARKTYLLPPGTNKIRFKAVSEYGNNLYLDNIYVVSSGLYPKNLDLRVLIQGFYNETANSTITDTIKVYLRNTTSPYTIVDSASGEIDAAGSVSLSFYKAENAKNYYYQIKHRNSLETWSSAGTQFSNYHASYDFTSDAAKAFGANMIKKGSKWCIYSGDVNQDGLVDLSDISAVYNDNAKFVAGYVKTDVTGDKLVDLNDLTVTYNNNANFVGKRTPAVSMSMQSNGKATIQNKPRLRESINHENK